MKIKNKATLTKVLRYIKQYRPLLAASLILAAASVVLTLYIPILIGRAIDCIVGAGNVDFAACARILIEAGALALLSACAQWIMNIANNRITCGVVHDVRRDAFRRIEELPISYLDSQRPGDIVSRVISDADQFSDGLLMGFSQLFTGVMTIFGTVIFMLTIDPRITIVVVLATPLSLVVADFIAKRTYSMFLEQSRTRGEQTALIDEMISNQKVVQAFGHESAALSDFDEVNDRLEKCSRRATFFSSITNPSTRFVNGLIYAAVGLTGALAVISGGITVGGLSCFLNYANQYTKPFNEISGVIAELQNAIACAGRLFELIDQPAQRPDSPGAISPDAVSGEVVMRDVYFSYTPDRALIESLNISAKPGQRIAIVGPTGCGKTTLINLLMRFYDVTGGSITVDGTDIRNYTRSGLRRQYGMVLQDTWLKSGTIADNIRFAVPDASDDDVIAAAKAAHAHSFIRRLPDGYDTVIGEDGGSLSQGQKQLLSIARVMLCRPSMLILDEATSSIDTRTEQRIQSAFARLMRGRTSFIVAHRLSTIREADMILVMRDGHIIEQGRHDELLEKGGFYSELWYSQFAGIDIGAQR